MSKRHAQRDINDPVYGFINIGNPLVRLILQDPFFQRLRRIHQMGMSYLVFPGARHSRFEHALGSMHLMQKAIASLRSKSVTISQDEENGLLLAILLHDVGHGPFSHAMERTFSSFSHEMLSLEVMRYLNDKYDGILDVAIAIFQGTYQRSFFNQLVSGQLDMDRLDYLRRDSFFTAVPEGHINANRIIALLNVVDDELVIEEKGLYPVENFLLARRFMYWQVYFHKVSLAAEQMLIRIFRRASEIEAFDQLSNKTLSKFLGSYEESTSRKVMLGNFLELDDYDIISAIKKWKYCDDTILSSLCSMIINRKLLKSHIQSEPFSTELRAFYMEKLRRQIPLTDEELTYFIFHGKISHHAYDRTHENIMVLTKEGCIKDISDVSDNWNLKAFSTPVVKHYMCYTGKVVKKD